MKLSMRLVSLGFLILTVSCKTLKTSDSNSEKSASQKQLDSLDKDDTDISRKPNAISYSIISWNVESGGANQKEIAKTLKSLISDHGKIHLWGFSEVQNQQWAHSFQEALGNDYRYEIGSTGRSDRLAIIYDKNQFKQLGHMIELHEMNPEGRVRSPLAVKLKDRSTGLEFLFMVNHLYRSNAAARQKQAQQLNTWIQTQDIPVIAVGDYNFDYDIPSKKGNKAFNLFTRNNHFTWIKPTELIRTQCNPKYNSLLDFIFVNDDALIWPNMSSKVIIREGDCPDDDNTSDHRPVFAIISN